MAIEVAIFCAPRISRPGSFEKLTTRNLYWIPFFCEALQTTTSLKTDSGTGIFQKILKNSTTAFLKSIPESFQDNY